MTYNAVNVPKNQMKEFVKMEFIPALLEDAHGKKVTSKEEWFERRKEILKLLSENEYGITPQKKGETMCKIVSIDKKCASGHGILEKLEITFPTDSGDFTFPVNYFHPTGKSKHLTFILINFRPDAYDMYFPAEEIIDNGFGIAQFCYKDITSDDNDFNSGVAPMFKRTNGDSSWGKIGMWAFAASRVADVLLQKEETAALAVAGHSRLGKTALWCAAQDERIDFAFSNDSGCSGAAYERTKHENAETIEKITTVFPYWFCEKYRSFASVPDKRPFDQHMLLSLIAPRYVGIGSAHLDVWADPYSEQLSCIGASPVWTEIYKSAGFIGKSDPAKIGESFSEGDIHYHLRDGIHFFGRGDWLEYMAFVKKKLSGEKEVGTAN